MYGEESPALSMCAMDQLHTFIDVVTPVGWQKTFLWTLASIAALFVVLWLVTAIATVVGYDLTQLELLSWLGG